MMQLATVTRRTAIGAALLAAAAVVPNAKADQGDSLRTLYGQFLQAQNARDLRAVRATLLDSDQFLWVSDGRSVWGPDALVERMSLFQQAPVWRVVPDLDRAVAVPVSNQSAFLHLPLVLEIGQEQQPSRLRFLVSVLGIETSAGWRIAALFTTENKNAD
jgi:hypothetical protein